MPNSEDVIKKMKEEYKVKVKANYEENVLVVKG